MTKLLRKMHAAFQAASGLEAKYAVHERLWYALARAGYTEEDVSVFLKWIAHENSHRPASYGRRYHIPMMFGNIAEFDADLSLARAWERNRRQPPTTRETALQDLRPVVDPELAKARLNPAQSAGEVLRRLLQSPTRPQM